MRVKGVYQVFMPVSFEVLWELGVDRGTPTARLANFRTLGMPANVLKSLIMNVIADAAKKEKWLQVEGDTVRVDVDEMLKKNGFHVSHAADGDSLSSGLSDRRRWWHCFPTAA